MKLKLDPAVRYRPGSQRVLEPEETLERVEREIPKIGVTRVANITDLDRVNIPVYSVIRPSAARGAISIYSGKGVDEVQARISAVMEGFERCLAEQPQTCKDLEEPHEGEVVTAPYQDYQDGGFLDPLLFLPPQPVMPGTVLEWVEGWDLIRGESVFVPANAVYHPYQPLGGTGLFRSNTNGLAAGNTLEEAVLHGLLEVVERDALSLAERHRHPGREIELTSEDGILFELKKRFEDKGVLVKLWLLDTDLEVPTVVAALDDTVLRDASLLVMGAGAHLDPRIAVSRALTEAAQSRVVQIHGAREDTDREVVVRNIGYERMRRMNRYWYEEKEEKITIREIEDKSANTPYENIRRVLKNLKRARLEHAVVVNLSRPSITVPVVRTLIPGLEVFTLDRERRGPRLLKHPQKLVRKTKRTSQDI